MIIDYRKDPAHACQFSVFDSATGKKIDDLCIWYADDQAGIIRTYRRTEDGSLELDALGNPISTQHSRSINFARKA